MLCRYFFTLTFIFLIFQFLTLKKKNSHPSRGPHLLWVVSVSFSLSGSAPKPAAVRLSHPSLPSLRSLLCGQLLGVTWQDRNADLGKVSYPGCCFISTFMYEPRELRQGARFEQIFTMMCTCLECSLGSRSRELVSVLRGFRNSV